MSTFTSSRKLYMRLQRLQPQAGEPPTVAPKLTRAEIALILSALADAVPQDRASQLSREQLLDILQATEPHDEGGEPVVSMHHALFKRILRELDDDKRPLTFEEALEAQIKMLAFRVESGPYAIGANNYRKGAEWAREWTMENET